MLKQLIALALVVTTLTASAQEAPQPSKLFLVQQTCDPVDKMMQTVARYQEQPLFQTRTISQHPSGEWFEGSSMFFVNQDTGTYSMITLYPDDTACMQAVGTDFEPYVGPGLTAGR